MNAGRVAGAVATGVLAGAVGTAAMSATQALEMRVTGREASDVPAQVGEGLFGYAPSDEGARARLNAGVHWGHGIMNGGLRGLIGLTGLSGPAATALHFTVLWSADAALYRMLGIAPAPWAWEPAALGTDLLHKGVYATVTGLVHDRLDG